MTRNETLGKILCRGFIPVLSYDQLPMLECIRLAVEVGLEAVEISCRHPEAVDLIAEAKRRYPELAVGAATLVEEGRLRRFIAGGGHPLPSIEQVVAAGADFLVSMLPFRQETYENYREKLVLIPGVQTLGEGHQALDWGANLLKYANPQLLGGPEFFQRSDPATYRSFPFFTTGGMKRNIVAGYFEAQVLAVGAGLDQLLGADYIALQAYFDEERVRVALRDYLAAVESARRRFQPQVPFDSRDPVAIARASGRCLNAD